jgi:hypothetical protein
MTMAHLTRTFTVAELEEIGAPDLLPGDALVLDELIETDGGWTLHSLLFRHDGAVWRVPYRSNDSEGVDWYDDEVTATAVEEQQVTVTKWVPVVAAEVTT